MTERQSAAIQTRNLIRQYLSGREFRFRWSSRIPKAMSSFCIVAGLLAVTTLSSCRQSVSYTSVDDEAGDASHAHGSVVESVPFADVDPRIAALDATALRVRYRSTSAADGSPTEASGALFIPRGDPPHDGWPIIALAPGVTATSQACVISRTPDIAGWAGIIATYLKTGFAVAAADYPAVGDAAADHLLDPQTAGLNLIDAVRALRASSDKVSNRWAAYGQAEGGAAAWAANEQIAGRAAGLRLVGVVIVDPLIEVSSLVSAAADRSLTPEQKGLYTWVLTGLQRTHPTFDIDDYRRGLAKDNWNLLTTCAKPQAPERLRLLKEIPPEDLEPATPEATQRMVDLLTPTALPQRRAQAPMLVAYGGDNQLIPSQRTRDAIARACAMGSWVAALPVDTSDEWRMTVTLGQWLNARFDGFPAASSC